jgi:hypothetical protein
MKEWIDHLAELLGEDSVTKEELRAVLGLARDVAHGVERKLAPVSTYLVGVHVGRSAAAGGARPAALRRAIESAAGLLRETPGGAG